MHTRIRANETKSSLCEREEDLLEESEGLSHGLLSDFDQRLTRESRT